jgi:hypothetical protein
MTREQALPYVGYCLDDALSERDRKDMPDNARLVGWQCGFEPMFVAVWSFSDGGPRLNRDDAEEIARDFLIECGWFDGEPKEADYVL